MAVTVRNPGGYFVQRDRLTGKVIKEADTFTCKHCGGPRPVTNRKGESNWGICYGCGCRICLKCLDDPTCVHIERRIELEERRSRLRGWQ